MVRACGGERFAEAALRADLIGVSRKRDEHRQDVVAGHGALELHHRDAVGAQFVGELHAAGHADAYGLAAARKALARY